MLGVPPAATLVNARAAGSRARAVGLAVGRGGATAALAGVAPPPPASTTAQLCAQALGVCVTVGSFTLKLPQIHQCVGANSVEGLSLWSHYFELNMYLGSVMYHRLHRYPLSAWAENLSLVAQQLALVALLWALGPSLAPTHVAGFFLAEALFVGGSMRLPERFWPLLLLTNGFLNVLSNLAQLTVNFENKSIGQQSWITLGLALAGNCARIFTTLVFASGDRVLLAMFVLGGALNFIRAVQYWVYM